MTLLVKKEEGEKNSGMSLLIFQLFHSFRICSMFVFAFIITNVYCILTTIFLVFTFLSFMFVYLVALSFPLQRHLKNKLFGVCVFVKNSGSHFALSYNEILHYEKLQIIGH